MKNIFKITILLISMFLFSYAVNAEQVYTFSCDYRFNSADGKPIDIKVKVLDLPADYLTGGKPGKNYSKYVQTFFMNEDGNYQAISSTCQKGGYKNAPSSNNKMCILTVDESSASGDKASFLKEAFASGSAKCPAMYRRTDYNKGYSLTVASGLSNSKNAESINTLRLNCYEEDNKTAHNCNTVTPRERNSSSSGNSGGNGGSYDGSNPAGTFDTGEVATCEGLLGDNLTKLVRLSISVLRIVGMVIAIVKASLAILPAVSNPDKIKDAKKTCTSMGILLVVIGLFRPILVVIGNIFGFDLSCF